MADPTAPTTAPQSPAPTSTDSVSTVESTDSTLSNDTTPASGETTSSEFDFTKFDETFSEEPSEVVEADATTPPVIAPEAKPAVVAKPTPPAGKLPVTAPAPVKPAEATPTKPGEAPVKVDPVVKETPAAVAQPQQPPTENRQQTPAEQKTAYDNWRKSTEERLTGHFKSYLTEEDADKLLSKPEEVLPQMFARAHLDTYEAVVNEMYQRMPAIIQQQMEEVRRYKEGEEMFYGAFPKLREHSVFVNKLANAFAKVNSQITKEDFVQQVGMAAMAALKIPFDDSPASAPAHSNGNGTSPTVIARDIIQPGGGFVPAPSGGVAPTAPGNKSPNVWDQFAADLSDDDS